MYPFISSLVRNTLYPDLKDHGGTSKHPSVTGMRRRLFWLDHRNPEDAGDDGDQVQTSHTNKWEANMVVALVWHLSRQGAYGAGQIAVITPYLGQLRKLQKKLGSICELLIGDRDQEQLDLDDDDSDSSKSTQQAEKRRLIEGLRVATVDNFQVGTVFT
jgi:AAA domain